MTTHQCKIRGKCNFYSFLKAMNTVSKEMNATETKNMVIETCSFDEMSVHLSLDCL